jgi:hypothetical protein
MVLRVAALYNNVRVRINGHNNIRIDKGRCQGVVRLLASMLIIQILGQFVVLSYTFYFDGFLDGGRPHIVSN